jgi:BlaI family penicillinase repressor
MKKPITEAEYHLMEIIWDAHPVSASEITARLKPDKRWHRKTVNTLLTRLVAKGAIDIDKDRSVNHYCPLVERSRYQQKVASDLVQRVFQGKITPLVAGFAEQQSLSNEDIEGLKSLLQALDDDDD